MYDRELLLHDFLTVFIHNYRYILYVDFVYFRDLKSPSGKKNQHQHIAVKKDRDSDTRYQKSKVLKSQSQYEDQNFKFRSKVVNQNLSLI